MRKETLRPMYCDDIITEEAFMDYGDYKRPHADAYEITFEAYNDGFPRTRKIIVLAYCMIDAINALCEDERFHITVIKKSPTPVIDATNKDSKPTEYSF